MKATQHYRNTVTPTIQIYDENDKYVAYVNLNMDWIDEIDDDRDILFLYIEDADDLHDVSNICFNMMYDLNII